MNTTEGSKTLRDKTPTIIATAATSVKSAGRGARVVAVVILGTVAFAAPLWLFQDSDWSYWLFVVGPPLLGALVALVAGGRARPLGIGATTFLAIGIIGLIWMEWGLAESGIFAVLVTMAEIVALYVTAGVWWIVSRLTRGRRAA
jgi:hypothetical protein